MLFTTNAPLSRWHWKFARDCIVIQIVSVFHHSSSSISDVKYTIHDRLEAINWILIRFLQGYRKLKLPPCGEFQIRMNLVMEDDLEDVDFSSKRAKQDNYDSFDNDPDFPGQVQTETAVSPLKRKTKNSSSPKPKRPTSNKTQSTENIQSWAKPPPTKSSHKSPANPSQGNAISIMLQKRSQSSGHGSEGRIRRPGWPPRLARGVKFNTSWKSVNIRWWRQPGEE